MDGNYDLKSLNSEELAELQETNSKTIAGLEDEIRQLKIQISQYGPNTSQLAGFKVKARSDGSTNYQDVQNRLHKEIEKLLKRVHKTETLTNITIDNVEREVLELCQTSCRKRFTVAMKILGRRVDAIYEMFEDWSTSSTSSPPTQQITEFEVKFESDINDAIGDLITEAADSQAFHGVFQLLKSYLEYKATQTSVVHGLMDKYPGVLSVQEVETDEGKDSVVLTLSNPDNPRHPTFHVTYGRHIVGCHIEAHAALDVQASG